MDNCNITPYNLEVTKESLVRFQLIFYAWMKGISLSDGDMNALTYLGVKGAQPLIKMCDDLVQVGVFKSVQCARNAISQLENNEKLLYKRGGHSKTVYLSEDLHIVNHPSQELRIRIYAPNKS